MGTKKLTAALILCAAAAFAATPKIQLGVTKYEAAKFSQDYEIYGKESAFYRNHGVYAALIDYDNMIKTNRSQAELARDLKRHHVVFLRVMNEGVHQAGPQQMAYAENVGKTLLEYVKAGGGLIIQPCTVRYPGDDDEKYWNQVYKAFGFQLEREGVADLTTMKMIQDRAEMSQNFFYTSNVVKHPATAGINGLWLPVWNAGCNRSSGSPLLSFSPEWKVVIRGNKTAQTYCVNEKNHIDLNLPGKVKSEPPLCAVRTIGKGRVAVLSASFMHTGLNVGLASWYQIAEKVGADNKPGQTMDLMLNLVNWCSGPSRKLAGFGTYDPPKYERVKYPESINFDTYKFMPPANDLCKGVLGAHTSYTDGKNTVAEYVAAAKKNGLRFIVFADPLEKLTKEKLEQLKKDCIANSSNDFVACPGIEFTDGAGVRWFFYGPKITWPDEKPFYKDGFKHTLWDGKVIKHFGQYSWLSNYCANGIIDFKDLKTNKIPRENLWWIFRIITHAWDHDKLIANNVEDYKFQLRDVRWLTPISFTRITKADQIPMAMNHAVTAVRSMNHVRQLTSSRFTAYHAGYGATSQVSLGNAGALELKRFQAINIQKDPRVLKTKGVQRAWFSVILSSPYGIKEVVISDGDRGVIRRFDGKGVKEFRKEFELVHDKQHYLLLEAVDGKGNKVVSHPAVMYDYKQGYFRCGDNLNTLGALGLIMHPDRSEKFPQIKPLRNANLYSYFGEDSGSALCPHPIAQSFNIFYTNNGEAYPSQKFTVENLRMDLQLSSGDLQIGETIIDSLCEKYDNERRPGPAMSSPARIVEEHPWFVHKQRIYSARDRVDFHVQWDHRRMNESLIDYDGGFQYFEGEVTFKRDITFNQHTYPSIALGRFMIHPQNVSKMFADQIIWIDPEKGLQNVIHEIGKKESMKGTVAENGFMAFMNSKIGYLGIIPVTGQFGFSYSSGRLMYGPLMPGKSYKKGDVVRYAYITGTFSDKARDEKRIAQAAGILRDKTYPNTLKKGTLNKNGFFYDVTAKDHQAEFTLHKTGLGIDLPIRIRGLENNGCAAAYTSQRPWFRFVGFDTKEKFAYLQEPIDQKNDIWVGNVFLASDKNLKLTLVVDGQDKKKGPFLEIHNPTGKAVTAKIWSPAGTPVLGGKAFTVAVPAKDSVFCDPDGKLK